MPRLARPIHDPHPVRAAKPSRRTHLPRPQVLGRDDAARRGETPGPPGRHLPRTAHLHLQRTAGAVQVGAGDGPWPLSSLSIRAQEEAWQAERGVEG